MKKKKGNLTSALKGFDRRPSETAQPVTVDLEEEGSSTNLPPSRRGKKALTGYFDPEVIKQLKLLAAEEDKTMQSLMSEALNELFKKYGRPHIA